MTVQHYLDLVTQEYDNSPNFLAMIALGVSGPVQVQTLMQDMITLFDLSTPPVGNQLDIIGQWVGISREVAIPATGLFFSWDDTIATGWDSGSWEPPGSPVVLTSLSDAHYLTLIFAKIAANRWDGTIQQFYQIMNEAFAPYTILLVDHQDMSYSVGIVGNPVDAVTLALFTGGYIPVRPEGVKVTYFFTNANPGPIFAWDMNTADFQGWDSGSWVTELLPT